MDSEQIRAIAQKLSRASHAVFFGGAGMSTASGIPDFRGAAGLYTTSPEDEPEYLLSDRCLTREPERFFAYCREHILYPDAKPNPAHEALAALERMGILKAVITQNIDGLHQKAGSRRVLEIHGSVARAYCMNCGRPAEACVLAEEKGIPRCETCGGVVRPDVVLYGEYLPQDVFEEAVSEVGAADFLIVGGSSLTVQPAASLVDRFLRGRGEKTLVILNRSRTMADREADFVVRDPVEEVLPAILRAIGSGARGAE